MTDRPKPISDMDMLDPAFRVRLEATLRDVEREGHEPRVFETYRSAERGDWLKARGSSSNGRLSMHRYGIAADVICRKHLWDCGRKGCDFYAHLGAAAQSRGLTWGGEWRMRDLPHVQGIPVAMQDRFRELSLPLDERGPEKGLVWV